MQISTTKRRSKAKPQGEGELSKLDNSAKRAADLLGIHRFSLDVLTAFGVPGTPTLYGEIVETLAEVATAHGDSERTVGGLGGCLVIALAPNYGHRLPGVDCKFDRAEANSMGLCGRLGNRLRVHKSAWVTSVTSCLK